MSAARDLDTLIMESALDFAVLAMDLSGSIIRWSRGAEHVLGWSEREALGQPGLLIFTPEDRAAGVPEREIASSLQHGRSLDERWHLRRDQTRFWGSGEMMVLRAADGTCIGLLKIIRDRTERWLGEQKQLTLAKLGEGLANMVDPSEIATLAAELVRTTLNATAAAYATVADPIQLVGTSFAANATIGENDLIDACAECVASGTADVHGTFSRETTMTARKAAGGAYCVVPLFESQRLVATFAVVSDVERRWTPDEKDFIRETAIRSRFAIERRRAEDALRELASNLEKQVERRLAERNRLWAHTRDLMAIVDPQAYITEVNPAWNKLLGWDAAELLGRSMLDLTDEAGVRALREALTAQRPVTQLSVDLRARDQRMLRLEWSISHDEAAAYLVGRDVTGQLEIEARLRQSQKMEAIGQLTGGIAHDFNNLLAGITGSLDLLRLRIASNRREDIERHIQAARTAAHRAAALTHRLLAFSRQQPLDPTPIDINRLIAGMEELLRRTLHVRIELELRLHANSAVLSDAHQMENAILNLVINARDAMPRGGKIVITTEDCDSERPYPLQRLDTVGAAKRFTCVSVSDNGEGIAPEIVSKVFEPFFTTKPTGQGTGLGLSMIYGFVRQMGGEIDLDTQLGLGTTIRLYFPCADSGEGQRLEAAALAYPRGQGERVLVVEDDEVVRSTMMDMLREIGYVPLGVAGPQAAVEALCLQGSIDMVITDWGLPGLNGGELAQLARKAHPDLPICFVTGYNPGDAEIGELRPNEMLLTKPIGIDALARTVAQMLARPV